LITGHSKLLTTPLSIAAPAASAACISAGWHEPEATHLQMLRALADEDLLDRCYGEALERGYLWHEFGDSHLILP
jgi:S-adenosylmethionine:tRNA ribosyltransferase-isomerase